jgi:hypothetical protein
MPTLGHSQILHFFEEKQSDFEWTFNIDFSTDFFNNKRSFF